MVYLPDSVGTFCQWYSTLLDQCLLFITIKKHNIKKTPQNEIHG